MDGERTHPVQPDEIGPAHPLLAAACAAIARISPAQVALLARFLSSLASTRSVLHVLANGGLAAEAEHLWTDCFTSPRRAPLPRVIVPSSNGALLSMLNNDFSAEHALQRYVERGTAPGDGVLAMSFSGGEGRSAGIVRGLTAARANGLPSFAITSPIGTRLVGVADTAVTIGTRDTMPAAFEVAVSAYFHAALDEAGE